MWLVKTVVADASKVTLARILAKRRCQRERRLLVIIGMVPMRVLVAQGFRYPQPHHQLASRIVRTPRVGPTKQHQRLQGARRAIRIDVVVLPVDVVCVTRCAQLRALECIVYRRQCRNLRISPDYLFLRELTSDPKVQHRRCALWHHGVVDHRPHYFAHQALGTRRCCRLLRYPRQFRRTYPIVSIITEEKERTYEALLPHRTVPADGGR
jgi:hypothetical protein